MRFELQDPESLEAMMLFLSHRRAQGCTVGLTSGSFDIIHFQHFWYFIRCRRYCDLLLVGVDSDEHVRERKGPSRPFMSDFQRVLMVDALKPVAFAFTMRGLDDLRRVAEIVRPDFLFRNDDFMGREDEVVGRESAGEIVIIRDVHDHASTTEIALSIAQRLQ